MTTQSIVQTGPPTSLPAARASNGGLVATGANNTVGPAAVDVPLIRGLSKEHSRLCSINGWDKDGKVPNIKDWKSIENIFGKKPQAEVLKEEVTWRKLKF